jgi:hypothetical protein
MKKEIYKKVEDSIENQKTFRNRREFNIWYLTNFGIQSESLILYLVPP